MSTKDIGFTGINSVPKPRLSGITENIRRRLYEYRPRFKEKDFWIVQGLIILIAALHDYAESLELMVHLGSLYFLTITMFFIPLVYAALRFGFVGSLATSLWVMVVTIPDWALWHDPLDEKLGVILSLVMVDSLAVFIGHRVDREKEARHFAETSGEALKVSELKYRSLFESSPIPVLVLDPNGDVIESNPAANQLFDIEDGGNETLHLSGLVGEESSRELIQASFGIKKTPDSLLMTTGNGTVKRLKPTLTRLRNGQENAIIQAVLRDVTDEYNRQAGLRAYAASITQTQEEERARIARDLHDDTIQSLVLLCRQLDATATMNQALPETVTRDLSDARKTAERVVNELREFSTALRPPTLDDLGLIAAIRRLLRELGNRSAIEIKMRTHGIPVRLPHDMELSIFRIAQEALLNAERHSRATRISVMLSFSDDLVRLEVTDDGIGFTVPTGASDLTATHHLGIIGMQERANLFGGTLRIISAPGAGTKAIASFSNL